MKNKKFLIRISLIVIALIMFLACFKSSYALHLPDGEDILKGVMDGIVGVLVVMLQEVALMLFTALRGLTYAVTGSDVVSLGDIVFNKCQLTSANFFKEVWIEGGETSLLVESVGKYYVVIRNLSIAVLLGILVYIGIRMAISTVASEEAKYKKMLFDWVISLVLVFVLHIIIIVTFAINNSLVYALAQVAPKVDGSAIAKLGLEAAVPGRGLDELIVYGAFTVAEFAMVLMYIKRTIVLGFLIVIAPLITITYSLDKIGDGKSQALNAWLKEFVFTVIIQPFHCIIYIVFYGTIMSSISGNGGFIADNMGNMIFAASTAFFMLKAEGIVKKIFGIQPSSIGDAIGTGAMALNMATGMFKGNKGKKIDESKGKMPKMSNSSEINKKDEQTGNNENTNQNNTNNNQNNNTNNNQNNTNNGSNQNVSSSNGTENANTSADSQTVDEGTIKKFVNGVSNSFIGKHWRRTGGLEGRLRRGVSRGAAFAGMVAGATVGDFKTAASLGTATGNIAKTKYEEAEYRHAENKLEDNQRVFAGAYEDFARAYRADHADEEVSDQEIRAAAQHIYDGSGTDLDSQYERDFRDQMEQLSTSAEIMGYKNGFDYVNNSMILTQEGVILPNKKYKPKFYDLKKNSNNNSNQSGGTN